MPGRSPLSLQVLAPLDTPKGYYGLCHRFFLRNGREGFTYTPSCSRCSISKTKRDCKRRSSNCEAKTKRVRGGPRLKPSLFLVPPLSSCRLKIALRFVTLNAWNRLLHTLGIRNPQNYHMSTNTFTFYIFTYPSSCSARYDIPFQSLCSCYSPNHLDRSGIW